MTDADRSAVLKAKLDARLNEAKKQKHGHGCCVHDAPKGYWWCNGCQRQVHGRHLCPGPRRIK